MKLPDSVKRWVPLVSGLYLAVLAGVKALCANDVPWACSAAPGLESIGGLLGVAGNVPPDLLPGLAAIGLGAGALYKTVKSLKPKPPAPKS